MEDPLNPNIDGVLENVKRSYKAMIDGGNGYYYLLSPEHSHFTQRALF